MSDNNESRGIGFFGLLIIVLVVLKLCKVISWSCLWVFSPIWGMLLAVIIAVVIEKAIE